MRCVPAHYFTVSKALRWRSAIDDSPPYQRESAVWSLDKQQLFIDSLLNGYDVPKIYLHDLRGKHPTKVYAIVDGKQRLTTLWSFLGDGFPLAPDFKVEPGNLPELPPGTVAPTGGLRFSEFDPAWRKVLLDTFLSVVLIQNATEEDIEELFSRLNNGEPLNAAEKRNAMGGDMVRLIRLVAGHPFFTERVHFTNARYQHLDVAARFLLVESAAASSTGVPDLRSTALDELVRTHRRLSDAQRRELTERVEATLGALCRVFGPADPLLAGPSHAVLYYLFVRRLAPDGIDTRRAADLREFLERFQRARSAELEKPEESRSATMIEFTALMQHGTNDGRSLARRLQILDDALTRHDRGRSMESASA